MMQDKERVAIVIVTRDNRSTIKRAIESVTTGPRPADHITIVDNDSSDGTYDLLCELLGAKPITMDGKTGLPPDFNGEFNSVSVKILRKRLSTIGHSVNIGMQSKWQGITIFGFLDPTSWYGPEKIAKSIEIFNQYPAVACVASDCDNHYSDGRTDREFRYSFDIQKLLMDSLYDRNFLIRTQVFQKLGSGFNVQVPRLDDYELLLRLYTVGLIYHIPESLHNNTIKQYT